MRDSGRSAASLQFLSTLDLIECALRTMGSFVLCRRCGKIIVRIFASRLRRQKRAYVEMGFILHDIFRNDELFLLAVFDRR